MGILEALNKDMKQQQEILDLGNQTLHIHSTNRERSPSTPVALWGQFRHRSGIRLLKRSEPTPIEGGTYLDDTTTQRCNNWLPSAVLDN